MTIKKRTLIHNLIHNRISMFPSTSSRETLTFSGNKIHCSPRDQSLSVKCLPLMNTVFEQPLVININLTRLNNEHDDSTKKKKLAKPSATHTKQTNKLTKKQTNKQTNKRTITNCFNLSDPYSSQALIRASAASSNAGFGGTLRKHTLQTVNLHKMLNSVQKSERLKVWPKLIVLYNTFNTADRLEKTECVNSHAWEQN